MLEELPRRSVLRAYWLWDEPVRLNTRARGQSGASRMVFSPALRASRAQCIVEGALAGKVPCLEVAKEDLDTDPIASAWQSTVLWQRRDYRLESTVGDSCLVGAERPRR